MAEPFYITTPIYYANSMPHLGHLYTTIVADVITRHKRQRGFETYFLTGTDEHGINIQRAAEREGRTPQEQVDFISNELKRMFADFRLDAEHGGYDVFMRTTEPFHYAGVQHLWREIAKNKTPKGNEAIYKGFYEGWFCAPCAEYKAEDERSLNQAVELRGYADNLISEFDEGFNLGIVSRTQSDYFAYLIRRLVDEGIDFAFAHDKPAELRIDGRRPIISARDVLANFVETFPAEDLEKAIALRESFSRFQRFIDDAGLLLPRCLVHFRILDLVSEESWYFRLSDYAEWLIDVIENAAGLVRPDARKNEVLSFVRRGLQDLSISRLRTSVSWGVPVPDDEDHVMYVWLDALSNYITAIGYGNEEQALGSFEKYWPAVHLVGKDILRFHTVYWFSFLHAAGLELPKSVYAHGMWLDVDGRKMSKTIGNVIDVDVLHQHFQVDAIRYFVLRDMVFGQDGKFGYENLIERANADLASGLGNLASRTFSMITKYRDGLIPDGKISEENYINAKRAGVSPDDQELLSILGHARDEFMRRFDNFEFSQALETVWTVIARIDKMISDAKPWELIKDEKQAETLNAVLYRATETLRWLCILLYPVMPESTKNLYGQIGLGDDIAKLDPADLEWGGLAAGTKIGETIGVFPRIDKNKVMNEINEQTGPHASRVQPTDGGETTEVNKPTSHAGETPAVQSEEPSYITIDDFIKVELRVGEIKVAEKVPDADKLLRFEVDLGEEKPRQILAGLAEWYEPEKLIGRKVVVVANLKPRKMRGLESQGMICAASLTEEDTPAIATFLEDVKVGARLR